MSENQNKHYELTWYDGNKPRMEIMKHINDVHDFLNKNQYLVQEPWFGLEIKEIRETTIDPKEIVDV
jgi:hypothetical protein